MFTLPVLPTTDVAAAIAVVQGYNSNTYQQQDDPAVPRIVRHPALYTGLNSNFTLRLTTPRGDRHEIMVGARGQQYEPVKVPSTQPSDESLLAIISNRMTLRPRLEFALETFGSIGSVNSSRPADAGGFVFDVTSQQRAFFQARQEGRMTYALSRTLELRQTYTFNVNGTVSEPARLLSDGTRINHRGLDSLQVLLDTRVTKVVTERTSAILLLNIARTYALYVLDFSQNPPRSLGPLAYTFASLTGGHQYRYTSELSSELRVGVTFVPPGPEDPDRRPRLSPLVGAEFNYRPRDRWVLSAFGRYETGSINPRLGFGPAVVGGFSAVGPPFLRKSLRNTLVLIDGRASRESRATGFGTADLTTTQFIGSAEVRHPITGGVGVLVGYEARYSAFENAPIQAPYMRQLAYVGFSFFATTDRAIAALSPFQIPAL